MTGLFILLFLFVVVALVGLVLLQEGKGGGLTGNAAGMDSVMGARNPLRRWTVYFFLAFVVLVIAIGKWYASRDGGIPDEVERPEATAGAGDLPAPTMTTEVEPAPLLPTPPAPPSVPEAVPETAPAEGGADSATPDAVEVEAAPAAPTPPASPAAPETTPEAAPEATATPVEAPTEVPAS